MITNTKSLLHNLLETFSNKGFEGDNLNQSVLAAGAYISLLQNNEEAFDHFADRYNQIEKEAK